VPAGQVESTIEPRPGVTIQRECAANPQPSCYDQNRSQVTGGIELGPFPFQNHPTFQQVVTLTQRAAR
jgi:hypothetical protein